jgi:hypothetical protein
MRTILLILFLAVFFNLPFSKSQCAGFTGTATLLSQGCNGSCGLITATPSGGTPPYLYQLHYSSPIPGAVSDTEQVCISGTYYYSITDANNCIVQTNVVLVHQATTATINAPSAICENETTSVNCQVTGNLGPYSYLWDSGETSSSVSRSPGIMSVTVSDAYGCDLVLIDTILAIPLLDSMFISNSLDPFGLGHCENGDSTILNVSLHTGSYITSGTFHGFGVRNGLGGSGVAIFYPDSAVIDMGHVGNTKISYIYQTTTGCSDTTEAIVMVHATPDLTFLNLPDSLCPDSDNLQLINLNTAPYGSMGQFTQMDTLIHEGVFIARDINGLIIPNFIGIFDTLTPINAIGYQQINITYNYTSSALFGACSSTIEDSIVITDCCVWPGDTDSDGIVNNFDLLPIGLHYGETGLNRVLQTIDYTCHASNNWNTTILGLPSIDRKHVDCDGNGLINGVDTSAIVLNWAQTHLTNAAPIHANVTMHIDTTVTNPGDTVVLDVILNQSLIPNGSYGLAFTVNYDPLLVDSNSVYVTFDNSWLGLINGNMIGIQKDFYAQGELEVGLTRIDQTSVSGNGPIAQLHFIIKDDVLPKTLNKRLDLNTDNIRLNNHLGSELPVIGISSQILITTDPHLHFDPTKASSQNQIQVAPNPANEYLRIYSSLETIQEISLYNLTGQLILQGNKTGNYTEVLNIEQLPSGVYILNVKTEKSTKILRVIKK